MPLYQGIIGGESSPVEPMEPVLLWTNPNPTAEFAAQTIDLDLTEYEGAIVEFRNAASSTYPNLTSRVYVKKNDIVNNPAQTFGGGYAVQGYGAEARSITAIDNSSITFYNAYGSNGAVANTLLIPTKIYGVKEYVVEPVIGEVLWTNSAPTSDFADQTISLDLAGYDAVEIEAKEYKTQPYIYKVTFNITNDDADLFMGSAVLSNRIRKVKVNNTGVVFLGGLEAAFGTSSYSTNNGSAVPISIKGLKYK